MEWYGSLARPLLFALPAETAHRVAHGLLGLPLPWDRLGHADDASSLRTSFAGIELANPVGLAAGFDKTGERVNALGRLGFGYVVVGTFTRRPRAGNPKPRIVRDVRRASLVNAMGLPNPGAERAAATLARAPRVGPRIASIADEDVPDVIETHGLLEPHVDAIELNVSCPNVSWGRDRDNETHLATVLRDLRARRTSPLAVKLPPFETSVERDVVFALARIAVEGGADSLTCANTRPVAAPTLSTGQGGLSGRALRENTPRLVAEVVDAIDRAVPVTACGGIAAPSDAIACLDAGATTVQLYTGLIYRGPGIVGELTSAIASRVDPAVIAARRASAR